jgi:Na+/melibiose symporter-like transporter
MISGRNMFTYFANILMLVVWLILFLAISDGPRQFRVLTVVCLGIGSCTTIFYFVQIKERSLSEKALELDKAYKAKMKAGEMLNTTNIEKKAQGKLPSDWLKEC